MCDFASRMREHYGLIMTLGGSCIRTEQQANNSCRFQLDVRPLLDFELHGRVLGYLVECIFLVFLDLHLDFDYITYQQSCRSDTRYMNMLQTCLLLCTGFTVRADLALYLQPFFQPLWEEVSGCLWQDYRETRAPTILYRETLHKYCELLKCLCVGFFSM